MKIIKSILAAGILAISAATTYAGNIYLTGHDVLLHGGQNGYDAVILDYLRDGEGTRATYDVLYVTSGGTNAGLASVIAEGFGVTTISHADFGADPAAALAGRDAFVLPWWFDGGAAGSAAVTSAASQAAIESFFNGGGDIWGNSSYTHSEYYDFLPSGVAASGPSISGSSGFTATTEGAAIGITSPMINGVATHNQFDSFAAAFTVMETRDSQVISIALKDGVISDDGISTSVPDGGSTALALCMGLLGLIGVKRFQSRTRS